ncbi:hypothetical protein BDM02DRAFT_1358886 [Thelephora ganbajun]|uniref:Uncharacterized protein n=1 Tax=Thelephora ganbajun TaxID=370292 RepID=A0ACB6Z293_THEGA|nr:hypothetical protein BDM02DRAFT_1358886 [Thelephora ganbajun]
MERTRSNVNIRIVRVVEVFELKVPLRLYLTILRPREPLLGQYKQRPFQLEEYDCDINTDQKSVIWHGTSTSLQEINAKDGLIIKFAPVPERFVRKDRLVLYMFGVSKISVPPNTDKTVEVIIKRARASIPRLCQRELFGVYQLQGNHKNLGGKAPKAV